MAGSFGTIQVAASGMYTSQAALNVCSSNVSNSGVSGYTRRAAVFSDTTGYSVYTSSGSVSATGSGTDMSQVQQIRDQFLDASYRKENGLSGYWDYMSGVTSQLDTLDGYGDDSGLETTTETFFNDWTEASKSPEDSSTRSQVIEAGNNLADSLNTMSQSLDTIRTQTQSDLKSGIDSVNDIAKQLVDLNTKIQKTTASGGDASDLMDSRNTLLDKLSSYGNIVGRSLDNGGYEVYLGGQMLVGESGAQTISAKTDSAGTMSVVWDASGSAVSLKSGSLEAQVELLAPYTGEVGSFDTGRTGLLDAYQKTVDTYASALVSAVNTAHSASYDLNGTNGVSFFTAEDSSKTLTAGNLKVNDVMDDPDCLACSETGSVGDGNGALGISKILDTTALTTTSGTVTFSDFFQSLTQWTGFVDEAASGGSDTQTATTNQLSTQRDSLTTVSLDEEMTRMIAYQEAYSANAQVMSTISDLLDQVINNMKS